MNADLHPATVSAEALKTMALRMAALVDALEDRSAAVVDTQRAHREALVRAVESLDATTPRLIEAATHALRAEAASAVADGLGSSIDDLRRTLATAALEATTTARQLAAERDALARQQRRVGWTGIVALGVGAMAVIGSSAWWIAEARAEAQALAFPAAVHAATASGVLRPCGASLCARVGRAPRRAAEDSEYVVVE